jgi:hypothetical protein
VNPPRIVTLGAHGCAESRFFNALAGARVDTFCDLRLRRGMRGPDYAFANSARLQQRLAEMGIRYRHIKELAPSPRTRQREDDERNGVAKPAGFCECPQAKSPPGVDSRRR